MLAELMNWSETKLPFKFSTEATPKLLKSS